MPVRYQTRCPIRPSVTQVMQKVCLQASSDTPAPTSRLRLTPPGATSSSAGFVVFLSFPMLLHPTSGQGLAVVPPLFLPHRGGCALLASMHPPVFVQLPHSQHWGNHHQMDTKQTNAFFFFFLSSPFFYILTCNQHPDLFYCMVMQMLVWSDKRGTHMACLRFW